MADTPKAPTLKSTEAKIALLFLAFFLFIILTPIKNNKQEPDEDDEVLYDLSWLSQNNKVAKELIIGLNSNQVRLLKKCVDRSREEKKLFNESAIAKTAKYDPRVIDAYKKWVDRLRYY